MTSSQQKQYAQEFAEILRNGGSWASWQKEAESRGLYSRDIDKLASDVLFYVKEPYEQELAKAVADNKDLDNQDLHPQVYRRIIDDERVRFRNRTVAKMSAAVSEGGLNRQRLEAEFDHPLLQDEDFERALQRANGQRERQPLEDKSSLLIRGLLFAGIGLFLLLWFGGFSGIISLCYGGYNLYRYAETS